MGLFGSKPAAQPEKEQWGRNLSEDEKAIARYRYLLNTAPPEAIEQAHAEAFAQLTPEQRRVLLKQLAQVTPESERPVLERSANDPQALARLATRAEIRQPGAMERMFSSGGAPGFGSMMAGGLLGSVAGTVLGGVIAREFFSHHDSGMGDMHHDLASSDDSGSNNLDSGLDTDAGVGGDLDSGFDSGGFDSGSFDV
jgi:hypothetical protein